MALLHDCRQSTRWILVVLLLLIHGAGDGHAQLSDRRDIPNVSFVAAPPPPTISTRMQLYLRDELVRLTEQFSTLTLSSTDRIMRKIYTQSLDTFVIERRNLTELVNEMANYTNRAIMFKLDAIRNLVNISEQSYRRFAETDEEVRNSTAKFMAVSSIGAVGPRTPPPPSFRRTGISARRTRTRW